MGRSRKNDLTMAKEVLVALELNNTAKLVKEMEEMVEKKLTIP